MDEKRHFVGLDGLRGVAALSVALIHWFGASGSLPRGYLAVDFFFMLSGFVIAHAYEARLAKGEMGFWQFVIARVVRLWPLLAAGMLFGAIARLTRGDDAAHIFASLPSAFLMVPRLAADSFSSSLFPLDPPAWSLFFELVVNFLFAAVLIFARRAALSTLIFVALVSGGITLAHCLVLGSGDFGIKADGIAGGLSRSLFGFTIGVIVYRLHERRLLPAANIGFWPLASAMLILFAIPCSGPPPLVGTLDAGLIVLGFPMLLCMAVGSKVSSVTARVCKTGGALSYPFYILHLPVLWIVGIVSARLNSPLGMLTGVVAIGIALLVSGAVAKFYDEPLRVWLAARLKVLPPRNGDGRAGLQAGLLLELAQSELVLGAALPDPVV